MADRYSGYIIGTSGPATGAFEITPNDSVDFEQPTRALYIGSGGNITIETIEGHVVLLTATVTGTVLPIRIKRVFATGTAASALVGLF